MSDGNKKPGLRDISDLKARLGMLNTGAGGPAAPKGPRPPAAPSNPFAPRAPAAPPASPRLDMNLTPGAPASPDTAVTNLGQPAAPAAPVARAMPAAPASPAVPASPASPAPVSLRPAAPMVPQGGPSLLKPAAPAQKAQVDASAFFDAPSAQVLDEEPPPEAEFANPLQMGAYSQAADPVDLTAAEEEALQTFEGKQRGVRPALAIGLTVGVAVITLVFGFLIGDSRVSRRLLNAQIDQSVRVKDRVQETLETFDRLVPLVMAMEEGSVDWKKISQIPAEIPAVDAGLLASPVPLERDLNTLLARALVDISAFFIAAQDHRNVTLGRDKAELESMADGSSFAQRPAFAVRYTPRDPEARGPYIPPVGQVVALTGKPQERVEGEGRKAVTYYVIPTIDRGGKEAETPLTNILRIEKTELMSAGKANPMTLYTDRVKDLKSRIKRIKQYDDAFRAKLKEQAEREKVFSL